MESNNTMKEARNYFRSKTEEEINAQAQRIIAMLQARPTHFIGCKGRIDVQAVWQIARKEKSRRGIALFPIDNTHTV